MVAARVDDIVVSMPAIRVAVLHIESSCTINIMYCNGGEDGDKRRSKEKVAELQTNSMTH